MDKGLGNRIFEFAVGVIKFCKSLNYSVENKIIINQVLRSATSVGANYEEAQGAITKADFRNKLKISLKEMRESSYWLKIIESIHIKDPKLTELIDESEELKKIIGTISYNTKKPNE